MARFEFGLNVNHVMETHHDIIRTSQNTHQNSVVKEEVLH